MERLRRHALDLWLAVLSVVASLGSLAYPLGRDQGLYFYVAREWVVRGAIPYRDVLDHKTPGIYFVYALAIRLFGETMWGIRILDLVCVGLAALAAAELSASPGECVRPGVRGATWFGITVLYFGYLDYWNTAQSELWYAMFGVAGLASAYRIAKLGKASAVAGAFGGAAILMKPPAIWFVLLAAGWLLIRATGSVTERRARVALVVRSLALFGVAATVPLVLVLGYFGAQHALPAMFDIVVGANNYYVKHERGTTGIADSISHIFDYGWCYAPLVPAILIYLVTALVRFRRNASYYERHVLAAFALLSALAGVAMQGKYYLLHWTVIIPAFGVVLANAFRVLAEACERRGRAWAPALAFVVPLLSLYAGALYTWRGPDMWWTAYRNAYHYERGLMTRDEYAGWFVGPDFSFQASERVGDWLREHSTVDDLVSVRGFEPQIYAIAERHHGGRFFWTTFITSPMRAYRREEWLHEDRQTFIDHPPRYVVVFRGLAGGPDSGPYFADLGYRPRIDFDRYTILERPISGR